MGYRSRRRLDVGLLAIGAIVVAVVAAVAAAIGDAERISHYRVSARVVDGEAEITEVIDYDFGTNRRRGIFRDVDDLDPEAPIAVSSPTAPDDFIVQPTLGAPRIRIGDPDRTISGRHRYRIEYPLTLAGPDEPLAWDAIGTEWQVDIGSVEIHLVGDRAFTDLTCSTGRAGTWGGCTLDQPEPGHLTVTIGGLDAGEGVTIGATPSSPLAARPAVPPPPGGPADDPGSGVWSPALIAVAAALAAGAVTSRLVRRAGRELVWAGGAADAAYGPQFDQSMPTRLVDHDELAGLASTEFAPPDGLTAWQGGVLHREGVDRDHQVAWLLERAIDGHIRIDGVEADGEVDELAIVRRSAADDPADEQILDTMFGGRSRVALGEYSRQFSAGWEALAERLDDWQHRSPYWDPAGERRRNRAIAVGLGGILVGLGVVVIGAVVASRTGPAWLVGVGAGAIVAGAGLGLVIRGWELRVRTPAGSGTWILIESFRRFVERSEARHVEDAARRGRLREYTAWATAIGEADHWADVVRSTDLDPDERAGFEPGALHLVGLAPHLGAAASTASTSPTSSGGGGGGGSVGGGGGGGGGGSW